MNLLKKITVFFLGAVFIISGFSKAIDSQAFINKLSEYGIGYFSYLAPLVSGFEVFFRIFDITKLQIKI